MLVSALAIPVMATSLTTTGIIWACLSFASALLSCTGFYLPYWIQGVLLNTTEVSFGCFRRCSYPRLSDEGRLEIVHECGRYTTFYDIPSVSWQITTVIIGVGASVALLVAFTALTACCVADVITKATARALGCIQLVAAILILVGGAVYPNGWSSPEVREACGGSSDSYEIGTCKLSWSVWIMAGGVGLLLVCTGLSFKASRINPHSYRL